MDGWRVLVPDHRGHGLSTGLRVYVSHFDQYLTDLQLVCRHFSLAPARTAFVGHSMGGLVVARLLEAANGVAAAACLLSPYMGLQVRVDRWTLMAGKVLSYVWPWYRFKSRVRATDLSRDENYLQQRRQDTLISRTVTAGWFFAVRSALAAVHAEAGRIQCPLLVLQGDRDEVVNPQATAAWFQLLECHDRTFLMLPDHLHELLQEPDSAEITRLILDWLETRVPRDSISDRAAPAQPIAEQTSG